VKELNAVAQNSGDRADHAAEHRTGEYLGHFAGAQHALDRRQRDRKSTQGFAPSSGGNGLCGGALFGHRVRLVVRRAR